MSKNILIFNSLQENNKAVFAIFEELKNRDFYFFIASRAAQQCLGPRLNNFLKQILFIILLPFLCLVNFLYLAYYKIQKIQTIICLNINEKIIITPIAKLLKMKVVWTEDADSAVFNNKTLNKFISKAYKIISNQATIITFSNFNKIRLKNLGIKEKNIKAIQPGIKLNKREHQNNLFNELAQNEGKAYKRKFFTVGAVVELKKPQKIENLFQAIKHCLTVIPNMQLIIVGEGKERKNLSWLSKKMELDNITWFVGEQIHLKKWLDGFDVFVAACEDLRLADINILLKAMNAKLPIIGPQNLGLEEIIPEISKKNGCLVEPDNSEMLARQIIKLWRDKNLRAKIGKSSVEGVEKYFIIDRMVEEFEKII